MSKERKTYSKEFKQKAVELSNVRGNVQEIARELGIAAEYIYRWRKEQKLHPSLAFGGRGKHNLALEPIDNQCCIGKGYFTCLTHIGGHI